jgi:hypothetical protein
MNDTVTCTRCGYVVSNNICGCCGLVSTTKEQYCDMCSCVMNSVDVSTHNCLEKSDCDRKEKEIAKKDRPEPALRPRFECLSCGERFIDNILHECKSDTYKCLNCAEECSKIGLNSHVCVGTCIRCHKQILKSKLKKHINKCTQAAPQTTFVSGHNRFNTTHNYMNSYSVQNHLQDNYYYRQHINNKKHTICDDCSEKKYPTGHFCKVVSNISGKNALCVYCNTDITKNYVDHKCYNGEYFEVRCADCAIIKSVMMFRYHKCEPITAAICADCDTCLMYSKVPLHACNKDKLVHKINVKCLKCKTVCGYTKMRYHTCKQDVNQDVNQDIKHAFYMVCCTCYKKVGSHEDSHSCFESIPFCYCVKCCKKINVIDVLEHVQICLRGAPEEDIVHSPDRYNYASDEDNDSNDSNHVQFDIHSDDENEFPLYSTITRNDTSYWRGHRRVPSPPYDYSY